ncbi:hypothetical protein GCM10009741_31530 [Kribbella lupini]|uniref:Uncharacterized protein n=1 Tax=Kribbella lupini TaxID=291602 RepID=A0ABP4LME0_9ACTN
MPSIGSVRGEISDGDEHGRDWETADQRPGPPIEAFAPMPDPDIGPPRLLPPLDRELMQVGVQISEFVQPRCGAVRDDSINGLTADPVGRRTVWIEGEPGDSEIFARIVGGTGKLVDAVSEPFQGSLVRPASHHLGRGPDLSRLRGGDETPLLARQSCDIE